MTALWITSENLSKASNAPTVTQACLVVQTWKWNRRDECLLGLALIKESKTLILVNYSCIDYWVENCGSGLLIGIAFHDFTPVLPEFTDNSYLSPESDDCKLPL